MKNLIIDWQEQWALHAESYSDGMAHISLTPFGVEKTCLLEPGAGFGDLSHPTTKLMLRLMASHVKGKTVIDIGSGSGILTLSALLMGAKKSIGIEIDPLAVEHAKKNNALNKLAAEFILPEQIFHFPSNEIIVLMNMISSEQKEAWQNYKNFIPNPHLIITSGILSSDQKKYLSLTNSWGWSFRSSQEEEGWLGSLFNK